MSGPVYWDDIGAGGAAAREAAIRLRKELNPEFEAPPGPNPFVQTAANFGSKWLGTPQVEASQFPAPKHDLGNLPPELVEKTKNWTDQDRALYVASNPSVLASFESPEQMRAFVSPSQRGPAPLPEPVMTGPVSEGENIYSWTPGSTEAQLIASNPAEAGPSGHALAPGHIWIDNSGRVLAENMQGDQTKWVFHQAGKEGSVIINPSTGESQIIPPMGISTANEGETVMQGADVLGRVPHTKPVVVDEASRVVAPVPGASPMQELIPPVPLSERAPKNAPSLDAQHKMVRIVRFGPEGELAGDETFRQGDPESAARMDAFMQENASLPPDQHWHPAPTVMGGLKETGMGGAPTSAQQSEAGKQAANLTSKIGEMAGQIEYLSTLPDGAFGVAGYMALEGGQLIGSISPKAGSKWSEIVSGMTLDEQKSIFAQMKRIVASNIPTYTGEKSGRVTEAERLMTAEVINPGWQSTPETVLAALKWTIAANLIERDAQRRRAGYPTRWDLRTKEGEFEVGDELINTYKLTSRQALQVIDSIKRVRMDLVDDMRPTVYVAADDDRAWEFDPTDPATAAQKRVMQAQDFIGATQEGAP